MDAQQFEEAQKTKNELYYAIQAVDRLDFKAESYLGGPTYPGNYNGFLIRDDIDDDFKINWDNTASTANTPWRKYNKVDYLTSDWYDKDNSTSSNYFSQGNETSQDQIIGLLMGFAFVKKFVDNNAVPYKASFFLHNWLAR